MSRPRNVTPDLGPESSFDHSPRFGGNRDPERDPDFGQGPMFEPPGPGPFGTTPRVQPEDVPPEWYGWAWSASGRGLPWLGLLLVLVGAALLLQYLVPQVSLGTLILLGISGTFLYGWLVGGSYYASIPGLLLLGLAIAQLIGDFGIYTGSGVTSLAVGGAFGLIALVGRNAGKRQVWALWGLAVFGLIGLIQLLGGINFRFELGGFWPLLVIAIGVFLVFNGNHSRRRRHR